MFSIGKDIREKRFEQELMPGVVAVGRSSKQSVGGQAMPGGASFPSRPEK